MPAMTIDLLPTLPGWRGHTISNERIIDGRDLWPVLSGGKNPPPPHDALYFYWGQELHAVRQRQVEAAPAASVSVARRGRLGRAPGKYVRRDIELSLYDLDADPREAKNVAAANPAVVAELMTIRRAGARGPRRYAGEADGEECSAGGEDASSGGI